MKPMSVSELVQAWADAWSSGPEATERFVSLFTDDCLHEDVALGAVNHGKDQVAAFFQAAFSAIPDHRLELVHVVAADDGAGVEWVITGTHSGDFPGLPATGKTFRIRGTSILRVRAGKLYQVGDFYDLAGSGLLP